MAINLYSIIKHVFYERIYFLESSTEAVLMKYGQTSTENAKKQLTDKVLLRTKLSRFLLFHSKEVISAVVVGVLVTLISTVIINRYFSQPVPVIEPILLENTLAASQPNLQVAHESLMSAHLQQVIVYMQHAKLSIMQHYAMTGHLPKSTEEFDIARLDLSERELIDQAYLTETGGIGILLSSKFGEDKQLELQPSLSSNKAFLRWGCATNVEEKYLGPQAQPVCQYQESFSSR